MRRISLTSDLTVFVNEATGSDTTGDGTSTNPWKHPSRAWDLLVRNYDLRGFKVTIQMQGNITVRNNFNGALVGQINDDDVCVVGDNANPLAFAITGDVDTLIAVTNGARLSIEGTLMSGPGFCINVADGVVVAKNLYIGTCGEGLHAVGPRSVLRCAGTITIGNTNMNYFAVSEDGALIAIGCAVYGQAANFYGAFVQADWGGMVDLSGSNITGSAAGRPYIAAAGGKILKGPTPLLGQGAGVADQWSVVS